MPRGLEKAVFPSTPGGIRADVNPLDIPAGQWRNAKNWRPFRGVGKPRPGYDLGIYPTAFAAGDRIDGIHFGLSPSGLNSYANEIIHTASAAYHSSGVDLTGTWSAIVTPSDKIRMANFYSSGEKICRVSIGNAVDTWDLNTANDFVSATGAPAGTDLTVIEPFLIVSATNATFDSVQWCAANNVNSWPAINVLNCREEPGTIFAVRSLNSTSFAVYKWNALWLCSLQAAKVAFQKQFIGRISGPTNAALLVSWAGTHFWLGSDFIIYAFDGRNVQVVSQSVAPFISELHNYQGSLSYGCGVYVPGDEPELWFFIPHTDGSGGIAICHNLRMNATTYHETADAIYSAVYAGHIIPSSVIRSYLHVGDGAARVMDWHQEQTTDRGTAIPWSFKSGPLAIAGVRNEGEVDGVLSYWKKPLGSLSTTATVTTSNSISDDESSVSGTFDPGEATSPHRVTVTGETTNPEQRAKWASVEFSAESVIQDLEFRGAALLGWGRSHDE